MADSSLDMVSDINWQELTNAVDQTKREISNRFDFKGTKVEIELKDKELTMSADDDNKLNQLKDVFHSKLIKRGISLKAVDYKDIEKAAGTSVRQKASFVSGLPQDAIKKINKMIKDQKFKVKTQVLDQKIRMTSKSRDTLQAVIKAVKELDLDVPVQTENYK